MATIAELERRLAELYQAESAALAAKRYKVGSREKEMQDYDKIRNAIAATQAELETAKSRNYGTRKVILMDY